MQLITVENDGTTTVKMTDAEAHALRDTLAKAAASSNDAAWTLSRLLAHTHGDGE